ncbi:DUF4422 domain-containing protein [Leuconostoc falkenbergense]|uniref:DUF4422 domain-containing protein n=1 Tax=Leuconostoc falkenbergense TaxID=2766470 RepID=UPI0024A8DBA7|nr:DUF4422 domain-containing protein [Leuconostoc falkenbergense]MDI6552894.1 DUF4422 domain-containing protein [Leuconostoc falkenbergense]
MSNEKIQILVAAHKEAPMPKDKIYLPVQVGSSLSKARFNGYQADNQGENISAKNPYFNELTAIYWARFNSNADIIGLVHYRRFFGFKKGKNLQNVLDGSQVLSLLERNDVILPKKRHYWIESSESHYRHAHHGSAIDAVRQIINSKYPDYIDVFEKQMSKTTSHMFNMFIMRREEFNAYSDWLFDILFEVESMIQNDVLNWSPYEKRVYGFLSERLLDVWIVQNNIRYTEVPVLFMEKQNWLLKGGKFLLRKFGYGRIGKK